MFSLYFSILVYVLFFFLHPPFCVALLTIVIFIATKSSRVHATCPFANGVSILGQFGALHSEEVLLLPRKPILFMVQQFFYSAFNKVELLVQNFVVIWTNFVWNKVQFQEHVINKIALKLLSDPLGLLWKQRKFSKKNQKFNKYFFIILLYDFYVGILQLCNLD